MSDDAERREPRPEPDTETLIRRVVAIIQGARTLPLSSSVKLDNKEEVLDLLNEAQRRLPEEVKQGRWMLKERAEYLARTEREGEEIVEAARLRAERMVQRTEIVREAKHTARKTLEAAEDEARRLRLEADDYCDQKLASFEIVLERTGKTVAAGRQKLATVGGLREATPPGANAADETVAGSDAFFDQDRG